MLEAIADFILRYKYVFIFYIGVIILAYIYRKRVEVQAKIIFLYRMKWGLKWMDKYSARFREWVILWGYIGTGVGFLGMIFISFILLKGLYDIFVNPATTAGLSLVLPGVNVPGLGVLPFWHWLVAIFLIATVHEFAHGIVARAHNIPVKNTGIVLFGPIIGAFVEPDEKKMAKQQDIKQYSVLAAGAWANVLLALLAVVLLNFATGPLQELTYQPGFTFTGYQENSPFERAGIEPGTFITGINNQSFSNFNQFASILAQNRPGDLVTFQTSKGLVDVTLGEHPQDPSKPLLGINEVTHELKEPYQSGIGKFAYGALDVINSFLRWLFILSLGIGLFNLLPLPIVDGGRMLQVFFWRVFGEEKGNKRYHQIAMFLLLVLVASLVLPWIL